MRCENLPVIDQRGLQKNRALTSRHEVYAKHSHTLRVKRISGDPTQL